MAAFVAFTWSLKFDYVAMMVNESERMLLFARKLEVNSTLGQEEKFFSLFDLQIKTNLQFLHFYSRYYCIFHLEFNNVFESLDLLCVFLRIKKKVHEKKYCQVNYQAHHDRYIELNFFIKHNLLLLEEKIKSNKSYIKIIWFSIRKN